MNSLVIDSFRKLTFLIFIISFVVTFWAPSLYKQIVYVEFILIAPITIIAMLNYKSGIQIVQVFYLIITFLAVLIGVPGSQYGFLSSAIIGLFAGSYLITSTQKKNTIEYYGLVLSALVFITGSLYLIYYNFKNGFSFEQIAQYFEIASINYVSLTVAAFCSIFLVWACYLDVRGQFSKRKINFLRFIAFLLSGTIFTLSILFSTRSVLFAFLPLLIYAFRPKHPVRTLLIIILLIVIAYFVFPNFSNATLELIVPGRENLLDLYDSELNGQERSQSSLLIFQHALPKLSFCLDCSDYLSFSAVANLLALTFPFSIFYVFEAFRFIKRHILLFISQTTYHKTLFLVVSLCFLNSLVAALFQADFLSLVALYFMIGFGNKVVYGKPHVTTQPLYFKTT